MTLEEKGRERKGKRDIQTKRDRERKRKREIEE